MLTTAASRRAGGWLWMLAAFAINGAALVRGAGPGAERAAFFEEFPELQFIEQRLGPAATLVIPPEPDMGRHVATDVELSAAFAGVLDDFLAPPSTLAPKAGPLIGGLCRYRPAQATGWTAAAIRGLLARALPGAEREVGQAVASAARANPALAPAIVGRAIEAIVRAVDARDTSVETATRVAGQTVLAAMRAVTAEPAASEILAAIAEESLRQALAQDAPYLVIELMTASVLGAKDRTPLGELCRTAFTRFGKTKDFTGLLAVGALRAAGVEAVNVIKDQAALSLSVPFAAYAVVVCNAYATVVSTPDATSLIPRLLPLPSADYVAAVMIGAIAARPEEATGILRVGLDRDLVLHGRPTTREILEAAILACGWRAPELAAAAVDHGDTTEGSPPAQIAEAVARAAARPLVGAALNAQMQVHGLNAEEAKAAAGGAIVGAVAAQRLPMLGAITFTLAAGTRLSGEVLDQAVVAAPPELQYAVALGTIAADREHAAELLDRAARRPDLAPGQSGPLAAGGGLILEIQRHPLDFFHAAAARLLAARDASAETTQAIVLAAALANPRGAPAVAALAAAATDFAPETLIATAAQADRAAELSIAVAVGAARQMKLGSGDAVNFVRQQIAADPRVAPALVTGCTAAAPELGDVIGEAAISAAPDAVARIVPRLFAFSTVRHPLAAPAEPLPVTLAALTDGAMRGVLAVRRDAESRERGIGEVTAAAVQAALALTRDPALAEVREAALAAVVTAATRAAAEQAIPIARIAARIVRALLHEAADGGKLRAAVLAASPGVPAAKITDAIGAGFAEADAQIPAPNAKALLDYAHAPLTGTPMTRFRDL